VPVRKFRIGDHTEGQDFAQASISSTSFGGRSLMHAAEPGKEISGMHPRTRGAIVNHHQLFAIFKAPQRRGVSATTSIALAGDG